ncbi:MAG: hypothetical protein JOZ16_11085 [Methylobacteriaceae bacterium]|nr:hypothetical protein [Methylobacteriaceae bacterium]
MSDISGIRSRPAVAGEWLGQCYVDWCAVIAGALIACAIFVLLTTFGSAIGLTLTSPYPGSGFSGRVATWVIGIWEIWVAVSAFAIGGYFAGRLRHRVGDATEHESDVRDSAHGLVVWAIAALLGTWIITMTAKDVAHAVNSGGDRNPIAGKADPARYAADVMLRTDRVNPAGYDEPLHREVASVLAAYATGVNLTQEDALYLTRVTQAHSGISQADAEPRVSRAVQQVRDNANQARRSGVMVAFLAAVSLAIGAAAAWTAAALGGRHRDEGIDASDMFRWR